MPCEACRLQTDGITRHSGTAGHRPSQVPHRSRGSTNHPKTHASSSVLACFMRRGRLLSPPAPHTNFGMRVTELIVGTGAAAGPHRRRNTYPGTASTAMTTTTCELAQSLELRRGTSVAIGPAVPWQVVGHAIKRNCGGAAELGTAPAVPTHTSEGGWHVEARRNRQEPEAQ